MTKLLVLFAVPVLLLETQVRADWEYIRSTDKAKGTLTVSRRNNSTYVSVKQLCFAMGCSVSYQWERYRAVIRNKEERISAIVSNLASVSLVDGRVLDFQGQVVSDLNEGYLLPLNLAGALVEHLKLGRIIEKQGAEVKAVHSDLHQPLKMVVIDPGHGGNDMGTGFGSIYEKDVAYIYAAKLRDEMKKALPEVQVLMTREEDRYVSLPDRAKIANALGATLFLSLHVNHAPNLKVEGVETYILSTEASDDEAKKLALLENDTWLKTAKIKEAGDTVRKIIADMEQTKFIQNSALAAAMIQQQLGSLDKTRGLKNRGVKQAMFFVLSQVAMPSVLVEIGFLSNTGDRSRIMNVDFRDEFVKSVVRAIKSYKEKVHP